MNNEKLKWHKLPKEHNKELVDSIAHSVLARNDRDDMVMGYLSYDTAQEYYFAENDNELLERVTHYINESELLKLDEDD